MRMGNLQGADRQMRERTTCGVATPWTLSSNYFSLSLAHGGRGLQYWLVPPLSSLDCELLSRSKLIKCYPLRSFLLQFKQIYRLRLKSVSHGLTAPRPPGPHHEYRVYWLVFSGGSHDLRSDTVDQSGRQNQLLIQEKPPCGRLVLNYIDLKLWKSKGQ
jgi:hypothetical protein